MTSVLVHQICRIALMVALCAIFIVIALLFNQKFESVAPANEILWGSDSYGELPPVW
jgi:hypothetical protein